MSDNQPKTPEEQQADILRVAADQGLKAFPAPDPRQSRAALDALLNGRPQLAALALNLVHAALSSGTVTMDNRTYTSGDIVSTLRQGRRARMLADRAAMIEAEFPAALQPTAHALATLGDTRKAGEKAAEKAPVMIHRAKAEGMKPKDIARLLQVTESHVYTVLRTKPGKTDIDVLAELVAISSQYEQDAYNNRRARVPKGRTLYNHRVEWFDGTEWQTWDEADSDEIPGTAERVAAEILAETEKEDEAEDVRTHRARVLIWEGPTGDADEALYILDRKLDDK